MTSIPSPLVTRFIRNYRPVYGLWTEQSLDVKACRQEVTPDLLGARRASSRETGKPRLLDPGIIREQGLFARKCGLSAAHWAGHRKRDRIGCAIRCIAASEAR